MRLTRSSTPTTPTARPSRARVHGEDADEVEHEPTRLTRLLPGRRAVEADELGDVGTEGDTILPTTTPRAASAAPRRAPPAPPVPVRARAAGRPPAGRVAAQPAVAAPVPAPPPEPRGRGRSRGAAPAEADTGATEADAETVTRRASGRPLGELLVGRGLVSEDQLATR